MVVGCVAFRAFALLLIAKSVAGFQTASPIVAQQLRSARCSVHRNNAPALAGVFVCFQPCGEQSTGTSIILFANKQYTKTQGDGHH